jgi:hypothetical protein
MISRIRASSSSGIFSADSARITVYSARDEIIGTSNVAAPGFAAPDRIYFGDLHVMSGRLGRMMLGYKAALEFSIVYPGTLLAVDDPVSHEFVALTSHGFINPEADSSDLPAGSRRIAVALAGITPVSSDTQEFLTVRFPLRCSDFSGGWPAGRAVTVDIQDVAAWKAVDSGLPAPVAASGTGVTVNVDCTTVTAIQPGFSTLKARHHGGGR